MKIKNLIRSTERYKPFPTELGSFYIENSVYKSRITTSCQETTGNTGLKKFDQLDAILGTQSFFVPVSLLKNGSSFVICNSVTRE